MIRYTRRVVLVRHTIQKILTEMFVYALFSFHVIQPMTHTNTRYVRRPHREDMRKELEIKFKNLMKERNEWYVHSSPPLPWHTHTFIVTMDLSIVPYLPPNFLLYLNSEYTYRISHSQSLELAVVH